MTSSQEPPLTRREARERERLLQEQQAAAATADAAAEPAPASPAPSVPAPERQSTPPVVAPPAYAAPRPAAPADSAPHGTAVSPSDESFAPREHLIVPPRSFESPAGRNAEPHVDPSAPERTLTRRELRAMLDANVGDLDDLDAFDFDDEADRTADASAGSLDSAQPVPAQHVPVRAPAPHQVADAAIADEPVVAPKPVGHWTAQLNTPVDRAEPFDQLLSRGGVSHGVPTTTNALILPSLPDHGSMNDSFAKTGDVIVTGSIDLPRSFGATGVHPSQIDSSDVDRLFDQVEDGVGVGAPVSATRAISTQSAARAMMAPPKKEGVNAPLVLAVTAGVLALGVVATLVIGAVSGLF
jgi:hypothetical protein